MTNDPFETHPLRNVVYGRTHYLDDTEIPARVPRSTKVSIGLPAGKDMHTWKKRDGSWWVTIGSGLKDDDKRKQQVSLATMREAQEFWDKNWDSAPEIKYPRKLPYFTFRRFNDQQVLVPDWAAIDAHGSKPTSIEIIFDSNTPFEHQLAWYGAGKRKCYGDGRNAIRRTDAADPQHAEIVKLAKERHSKHFPIVDGCAEFGCPHSERLVQKECKESARLSFQLPAYVEFGARSEYVTTGKRSIDQIRASLQAVQDVMLVLTGDPTNYLKGIRLLLVVEPYTMTPEGQKPTKAWAVRLHARATDIDALLARLRRERSLMVASGPVKPIPLIGNGEEPHPEVLEPDTAEAQATEDEFYPQAQGEDEEEPHQTDSQKASAATDSKAETLREKVKARTPIATDRTEQLGVHPANRKAKADLSTPEPPEQTVVVGPPVEERKPTPPVPTGDGSLF